MDSRVESVGIFFMPAIFEPRVEVRVPMGKVATPEQRSLNLN